MNRGAVPQPGRLRSIPLVLPAVLTTGTKYEIYLENRYDAALHLRADGGVRKIYRNEILDERRVL